MWINSKTKIFRVRDCIKSIFAVSRGFFSHLVEIKNSYTLLTITESKYRVILLYVYIDKFVRINLRIIGTESPRTCEGCIGRCRLKTARSDETGKYVIILRFL